MTHGARLAPRSELEGRDVVALLRAEGFEPLALFAQLAEELVATRPMSEPGAISPRTLLYHTVGCRWPSLYRTNRRCRPVQPQNWTTIFLDEKYPSTRRSMRRFRGRKAATTRATETSGTYSERPPTRSAR